MKTIVNGLTRLVRRAPLAVLITVLAVTAVFGALASQVVITDGNDGFAPDAAELLAADRIAELFGEGATSSVLQVVIESEGGDVITLDGATTVQTVTGIIRSSDLADLLVESPDQPSIVSYLLPVFQADLGPAGSDAELKQQYAEAFAQLPPDLGSISQQLLSSDRDVGTATASKGLLLVFVNAPGFDEKIEGDFDPARDFEDFTDLEGAVADQIRAAELPAGYSAQPFSFELIFGTGDEFQSEVGRLFGLAALIIVAILLFVYWVRPRGADARLAAVRRTFADMGLTMAAIFMAITWMNGIGVLFGPKYLDLINDFGPMNQIIPILLIGLGVDYAIHLTTRYREEVGHGSEVEAAVERAIHTVGVALVLATATTAVGFLTNLVSPIPALQDFGLLAAVGIIASFIIMLTFVASFRLLLDRRAERDGRLPTDSLGHNKERALPRYIGKTAVLAEKMPAATVIAALLLGVLGFIGVTNLKTEFSVTDFVPRPNPLLPTFETLLEDFGGGFGETTQVVVEGDVDTADAHNALAASLGNLRTTENVLQFGDFPAAESPVGLVATLSDPESETYVPAVGDAAAQAGFDPATGRVDAGADVVTLYDALVAAVPDQAGRILHGGDGGYDAYLVNITTQGGEAGAGDLNKDVRAAFDPVATAGLDVAPTSDEIINDVVITSLSDSQLSSLVITVLVAMALLVINFTVESRRPALGVITIFPVALVMLWAFGLMPVLGLAFGPVTATVSALAIGIGVPYMIHITHRFQEDRIRFDDPIEAIRSTTTNTGGALAGSAFTTVAGFGILTTASLVPFRQLGLVTAYTILFALIAAVIVLPSMLVLWDRWHRNRGGAAVDADAVREALG